jgi:hypothetical protein
LLAGTVALVALAAFGAWRGDMLAVLAARMLNPASRMPYPTLTRLESPSGDLVVRTGEPVTLTAVASGVIPTRGRILLRYGGLGWETVELPPLADAPARFEYRLPHTQSDVDYYFRAGDGRSRRHQVKVVQPPSVEKADIRLTFPAYTRLGPRQHDSLTLKVPEGTVVTWNLTFSDRIEAAELVMEGAELQPMELSRNGRTASAQRTAEASRAYQVRVHWRLGNRDHIESGARAYLQVIPDADPRVTLLQPSEDVKATIKKIVNIVYSAQDDYGLATADIVFSVNDGGELRHPLGGLNGRTHAEAAFEWPVTTLLKTLKDGDLLTFAIEVADARPGQAGRNRSLSRRVQFVRETDYLEFVVARQRKALGQLRSAYLQEKQAVRELTVSERTNP